MSDTARKVESACLFLPGATPTHALPVQFTRAEIAEQLHQMDLCRAVMRGQGFHEWMTRPAPSDLVEATATVAIAGPPSLTAPVATAEPPSPTVRPLPVANLWAIPNQRYSDALLQELLPGDQGPFREYLRNRTLGIALITAAPGFGKTTLVAVAALAMEGTFGPVLLAGPTNIAVDNLAARVHRTTMSVADRCNKGKAVDDPDRVRHKLVIRAYEREREVRSFLSLLEEPDFIPPVQRGESSWTLEQSLAYWLPMLLGCRGDRFGALHPDASEALHRLREEFSERDSLRSLYAVAAVQAVSKDYYFWVRRVAGTVIDEAGNMHMGDLGCVWGNCGIPVVLAGDPRQLRPTVVTGKEKDAEGNFYNRLANDGAISPLTFFTASGLPVYRLRAQLRMANGLFHWVAQYLYAEVNFKYAPSCAIDRPEFEAGRILERYFRRVNPPVRPSPAGKLLPVFVHCQGAHVQVDGRTGSKMCRQQVQVAVRIASDLVGDGVDPSKITFLSPYAANVVLIHQLRKRYPLLAGIGSPSTVDFFQGQENDIIIVVMGTTFPYPGPGFTTDAHRLNVLLTRQRCGLVLERWERWWEG
ncbi:DNA helicase [Parachaetomium inaequale]|uniref:DNA helicase n=1 Tax=Parachaetomium inaequale TaxID=2588326 RepID=A0AAN6PI02_9PEZI|nr:DNA helicase [Parachaetomium inaequale]